MSSLRPTCLRFPVLFVCIHLVSDGYMNNMRCYYHALHFLYYLSLSAVYIHIVVRLEWFTHGIMIITLRSSADYSKVIFKVIFTGYDFSGAATAREP
jgi:hypothetical protein